MIHKNQRFLNILNVLLDAVLIFVSIVLAFYLRFFVMRGSATIPFHSYLVIAAVDIPVQLFLFFLFHLYEPQRKKRLYDELGKMLSATTIAFGLLFSVLFITKFMDFSRIALFFFYITSNLLLGLKRVCLRLVLRRMRSVGFNQKHVLIIGSNLMARRCLKEIRSTPELGYIVHGYLSDHDDWTELPCLGTLENLEQLMVSLKLDEVMVAMDGSQQTSLDDIIFLCDKYGARFTLIPFFSQLMTGSVQLDSLNGIPILNLRKIPLDFVGNAIIKRIMDIIGSAILIILCSPIMLVVAIGVKLSSPGPIIFKQERVGHEKKPFYMFKFRSMRVNTQETVGWTTDTDPRKTKFGSFIRKYSLDELPQFFNVFKGDMSLVGPRPEVPFYVEQFRDQIPKYLLRQQVRPGITGWAQVNGLRGDTSIEERVRYDRWYIQNWSVGLDIVILLRTVFGGFMNNEVIVSDGKKEKVKK